MRSAKQDGMTVLLLSDPEREILRRALQAAKGSPFGKAEKAIIEAALNALAIPLLG